VFYTRGSGTRSFHLNESSQHVIAQTFNAQDAEEGILSPKRIDGMNSLLLNPLLSQYKLYPGTGNPINCYCFEEVERLCLK
jgi:hypothetical protein